MKRLLNLIIFTLTLIAVTACSDNDEMPQPAPTTKIRSVLVYMVADNNLSGWARTDLDEMRVAAKESLKDGDRWIVYYSGPDHAPRLIEFDSDGNDIVLATYSSSQLSVTIDRMTEVLADFKRIAPAESYGLVLWSHGTGWISDEGSVNETSAKAIAPQSFGYDSASHAKMKVTSLAKALQGNKFDFIYFDCCHMATVEVAYELRHITDRMIASPTELGLEGMPYDINMPLLLAGNLRQAMTETYGFYKSQQENEGGYGCSITLINLDKLDNLAAATRRIFSLHLTLPGTYTPVKYFRSGITEGINDMQSYIRALNPGQELLSQWEQAYSEAIGSFMTTPTVYTLPAQNFSGLGCHILSPNTDPMYGGYNELQWWHDVTDALYADN